MFVACNLMKQTPVAPVWPSMAPEVGRRQSLAAAGPSPQQSQTAHLKSHAHSSNEDRVNPLPKCVTINQSEHRKRTVVTQPATSTSSFSGVCNLKTDERSDFNDCYVEVKGDMQRLLVDAKFKLQLMTSSSATTHMIHGPWMASLCLH